MIMSSESASARTPESGRWRSTTGKRFAKRWVEFINVLGKLVMPNKQAAPSHPRSWTPARERIKPRVLILIATDPIGGPQKRLFQFVRYAPRGAFDTILCKLQCEESAGWAAYPGNPEG